MSEKESKFYIKEFYTLEQLATELNFTVQSIRKYVKNGDLKASIIGHCYITTRENINKWLENNSTEKN